MSSATRSRYCRRIRRSRIDESVVAGSLAVSVAAAVCAPPRSPHPSARRTGRHPAAAQLDERRRLERDLHDGAQQPLLTLGFELRAAQLNGSLPCLQEAVGRGIDQTGADLEELAARTSQVLVTACPERRFDPDLEAAAWFVSEAVTNAVSAERPGARRGHARERQDQLGTLTAREREVLASMAGGPSNQAIAGELMVNAKTVDTHISAIFDRLGLLPEPMDHRRVLAVLKWLQAGSEQPPSSGRAARR
jgi:ATP/maltotriose-dependent transcriptional regulator MalT